MVSRVQRELCRDNSHFAGRKGKLRPGHNVKNIDLFMWIRNYEDEDK